MNFKYIKNISENEATILLYGQIGDSYDENGNCVMGISGTSFAYEMQYLQDKCSKIKVRINSIGGSVLEGYSIFSSIFDSKVPTVTVVDGLAASISGVIAMAGKKRIIKDYATWMGHTANGTSDTKLLDLATDSIVTMIANNINKTKEEVLLMLEKETWVSDSRVSDYSLQEAVNMGLFDEIENTSRKVKINKITNVAEMQLIYNKIINNKPNMEKVTNLLNLSNEANEDAIVSAIAEKDSKNAELQAEVERLNSVVEAYEAKEKEAKELAEKEKEAKAIELVENAIKEKKIAEDEKDATIEMAKNNFEFVANMISKIRNTTEAVKVFDAKNVVTKRGNEDRSDWTIRDWEKKDAKGLAKIKNETPEVYNTMYNEYYKNKK